MAFKYIKLRRGINWNTHNDKIMCITGPGEQTISEFHVEYPVYCHKDPRWHKIIWGGSDTTEATPMEAYRGGVKLYGI
jgi:hypothetical protein